MKLVLSVGVSRARRRSCPGWMLLPANHLGTAGASFPSCSTRQPVADRREPRSPMTTTTGPHRSRHDRVPLTDPHPSDAGMLSPSMPPIGRYRRVPVQVHQADPDAPEVARRLTRSSPPAGRPPRPSTWAARRYPAWPARESSTCSWPPTRPISRPSPRPCSSSAYNPRARRPSQPPGPCCGAPSATGPPSNGSTCTWSQPTVEVAAMRGFRAALRAIRSRAAATRPSGAIVAGGPADPVAFTKANTTGSPRP